HGSSTWLRPSAGRCQAPGPRTGGHGPPPAARHLRAPRAAPPLCPPPSPPPRVAAAAPARAAGRAAPARRAARAPDAAPALPAASVARDPRLLVVRGKGGRERMVPLSEPARAALRAYEPARLAFLRRKGDERWLFPSRGGRGHLTRHRVAQLLKELAVESG